jgi:hypothetical protein
MSGPKEWRDLADALHDLEKHYSGSYEGALMEDAAAALMDAAEAVEIWRREVERRDEIINCEVGLREAAEATLAEAGAVIEDLTVRAEAAEAKLKERSSARVTRTSWRG